MRRWMGGLAIGLVLGAGAVLVLTRFPPDSEPQGAAPPSDAPAQDVRPATAQEMDAHEGYGSLAEINGLKSEFAWAAAVHDRLRTADVRTVEALLDEADTLDPGGRRHRLKEFAYARYVDLDPRAAVRRIVAHGDQYSLASFVFGAWAKVDLDAALDAIDLLQAPHREQAARAVLSERQDLDDDAQDAIAARFSLESDLRQMRMLEAAQIDPRAAWHQALTSTEGDSQKESLVQVLGEWIRTEPDAAVRAVASLPAGTRRWVQQHLIHDWLGFDRTAALDWALSLPAADNREVLKTALRELARTDPVAALEALHGSADHRLTGELRYGSWQWVESDPRAVLDWALSQPPSENQGSLIRSAISKIAQSSPEEALSLATRLDDDLQRSQAIASAVGAWARTDPQAAARWVDDSTQGTTTTVVSVMQGYLADDPDEAFEWLMTQHAYAQRAAIDRVIIEVTRDSPLRAREMVGRIRDEDTKNKAASWLVKGWIGIDPEAAVREIPRLGLANVDESYQTAFREWATYDVDGAVAFLSQVPAAERDAAINGIITQALYGNNDTATAERLYARLTGDQARRQAASMLYSRLRDLNPPRSERYREAAAGSRGR